MRKPPKYDKYYSEGRNVLGDPFPEVITFFENLETPKVVLDVGAGQGRDALPIAAMGHKVIAVDVSLVGLEQLREDAFNRNLDIEILAGDVCSLELPSVDILLADRTLHMLKPEPRHEALARILSKLNAGAGILIIDEPRNISGLVEVFGADTRGWKVTIPDQTRIEAWQT